MKQFTLDIPNKKYDFFMELIQNLDFVKKVQVNEKPSKKLPEAHDDDDPTKEQILEGLKEAVEEVKQIIAGKKKAIPLKDFLNEL